MLVTKCRLGLTILLLCLSTGFGNAAGLNLATGGKTDYVILVDPAAVSGEVDAEGKPVITPVQHAANELAAFLKQVTGADFPVVQRARAGQPVLAVGPGAVQRKLLGGLKLESLQPDGIAIETVGDNLLLVGPEPRGTLYAVYTFLEDTVGCRWWSSKASTIPHRATLTVPEQHLRYVPPLEYRETFWFDAFDGDFAVRNKSNGHTERLDEKRGGKIRYGGRSFVHTFEWLLPVEEFAAEHPEYYAERDGKRIVGTVTYCQYCVTNPEVKRLITERVLECLAKDPEARIISVSQADADNHCLCAECKKLEEYEGSPSGPLLHLVNYVAAEVAKKYPDVAVDTLAYSYTRKPPLHVKPLPNVIIRLCSIECDFASPLTSANNKTFAEDIRGWSKICKRLYIWDYTTNFAHYIMPFPNLRVLGPNVRFFVANGVKGLFEQGGYQSPGGEMAECRAWVLAKLLWNPKLNERKLVDEFLNGYYGPAAPAIGQYLTMMHDSVARTKTNMTIWVQPTTAYLTLDVMGKAETLFNQAEAAVKADPELLNRVQVARLPIRYVWSTRWFEFQAAARKRGVAWPGPANAVANARTFMDLCHASNITMLSEGRDVETFAHRTVDLGREVSPPPPGCEKLNDDQYADLQDASFSLYREGTLASLQHDDTASDRVAARMTADHIEWAVQQHIGIAGLDPDATYTAYASIRVEKTGEEGGAFDAGIYDDKNRKSLGDLSKSVAEITEPGYVTYKLGTTKLHDLTFLWVAPTKNPENVKAIWVDRCWLVKEK